MSDQNPYSPPATDVLMDPQDRSSERQLRNEVIQLTCLCIFATALGGFLYCLTGIFIFLDARYAGLRKDRGKKEFLNMSPLGWTVGVYLFLSSFSRST